MQLGNQLRVERSRRIVFGVVAAPGMFRRMLLTEFVKADSCGWLLIGVSVCWLIGRRTISRIGRRNCTGVRSYAFERSLSWSRRSCSYLAIPRSQGITVKESGGCIFFVGVILSRLIMSFAWWIWLRWFQERLFEDRLLIGRCWRLLFKRCWL